MPDQPTTRPNQKRYVVIDRNLGAAKITSKQAHLINPGKYDLFSDFQKGLQAILESPTTAAIIDMQIEKGGSGLAMLAHLRRDPKLVHLPVVLTTGTIGVNDIQSIHGYPCSAVVAKPLHQKELRAAFKKIFDEAAWYRQNGFKLDQALQTGESDPQEASLTFKSLITTSPNPMSIALTFGGILTQRRLFAQASRIYDEILVKYPSSIPTLNAKAKLFVLQGRHVQAKALLERSFQLAPKGIERLAILGDIEVSLKNPEAAIKCFQEALGINPLDRKSQVGLTVAKGLSRVAVKQAAEYNDEPSIAKIMNNLGVNLAQKGGYEKALKYYLMSLSFLGTESLQSAVSFNVGLGFKRWHKPQQAKYWLQESLRLKGGPTKKAEFHLSDLGDVIAAIGFGAPQQPLNHAKPSMVVSPIVGKPTSPIAPIAFDDTFLEEESVEMHTGEIKRPNKFGFVDDKMISELDVNLEGTDINVTFDEAI